MPATTTKPCAATAENQRPDQRRQVEPRPKPERKHRYQGIDQRRQRGDQKPAVSVEHEREKVADQGWYKDQCRKPQRHRGRCRQGRRIRRQQQDHQAVWKQDANACQQHRKADEEKEHAAPIGRRERGLAGRDQARVPSDEGHLKPGADGGRQEDRRNQSKIVSVDIRRCSQRGGNQGGPQESSNLDCDAQQHHDARRAEQLPVLVQNPRWVGLQQLAVTGAQAARQSVATCGIRRRRANGGAARHFLQFGNRTLRGRPPSCRLWLPRTAIVPAGKILMALMGITDVRIGIVGLGYVGLPLAVYMARHFPVLGFDIDSERIAQLKAGTDRTREVTPEEFSRPRKSRFPPSPRRSGHAISSSSPCPRRSTRRCSPISACWKRPPRRSAVR